MSYFGFQKHQICFLLISYHISRSYQIGINQKKAYVLLAFISSLNSGYSLPWLLFTWQCVKLSENRENWGTTISPHRHSSLICQFLSWNPPEKFFVFFFSFNQHSINHCALCILSLKRLNIIHVHFVLLSIIIGDFEVWRFGQKQFINSKNIWYWLKHIIFMYCKSSRFWIC